MVPGNAGRVCHRRDTASKHSDTDHATAAHSYRIWQMGPRLRTLPQPIIYKMLTSILINPPGCDRRNNAMQRIATYLS